MDKLDEQIVELLKWNSRMTSSEISKIVHLSIPAVSERIRKLEEKGIIEKFTLKLGREATGNGLLAFVFVTLERPDCIPEFTEKIRQSKEVLECHHLAGDDDYLLKVAVLDIKALEQFISSNLKQIPGTAKTKTVIALSTLKEE
ncbi:Leucine-responsive regulatory protein [compost metagenome]